jgi:hypothetical protein
LRAHVHRLQVPTFKRRYGRFASGRWANP